MCLGEGAGWAGHLWSHHPLADLWAGSTVQEMRVQRETRKVALGGK